MTEATQLIEAFRGAPLAMDMARARGYFEAGQGRAAVRSPSTALAYEVSDGVAVVQAHGLLTKRSAFADRMGWATYDGVEAAMRMLAADQGVSAIVLDIDSPGGVAYGVAAAAGAVAAAAASKPVYAFVDPLAASAAYHLASQASEIVLAPGSAVGSIGVAMMTMKPVEPDIMGDRWFQFTSSNAANKRPDPESDAGRAEILRELDEIEAAFLADVAAGRRVSLDAVKAGFGQGGVFFAESAIRAGLADRTATRRDFYEGVMAAHGGSRRSGRRSAALHRVAQAAQAAAQL